MMDSRRRPSLPPLTSTPHEHASFYVTTLPLNFSHLATGNEVDSLVLLASIMAEVQTLDQGFEVAGDLSSGGDPKAAAMADVQDAEPAAAAAAAADGRGRGPSNQATARQLFGSSEEGAGSGGAGGGFGLSARMPSPTQQLELVVAAVEEGMSKALYSHSSNSNYMMTIHCRRSLNSGMKSVFYPSKFPTNFAYTIHKDFALILLCDDVLLP